MIGFALSLFFTLCPRSFFIGDFLASLPDTRFPQSIAYFLFSFFASFSFFNNNIRFYSILSIFVFSIPPVLSKASTASLLRQPPLYFPPPVWPFSLRFRRPALGLDALCSVQRVLSLSFSSSIFIFLARFLSLFRLVSTLTATRSVSRIPSSTHIRYSTTISVPRFLVLSLSRSRPFLVSLFDVPHSSFQTKEPTISTSKNRLSRLRVNQHLDCTEISS